MFAHIFQDERRIQLWKISCLIFPIQATRKATPKSTRALLRARLQRRRQAAAGLKNSPENSHGWLHLLTEGIHLQNVMLVDSGEYIDLSFIFI